MDTRETLGIEYVPRIIDEVLQHQLQIAGAVVLEGPRGCGKTMTAAHAAASAIFLDDEASANLVQISPDVAFVGERPRLIDEWQIHPPIWNAARRQVDRSSEFGQFILTGSAVPDDDITRHTGAGRFLRLRQHAMTWFERGLSPHASVSLKDLFEGETPITGTTGADYNSLIDRLCTSGFPAWRHLPAHDALELAAAYIEETVHVDLGRLAEIRFSPDNVRALLKSLARLVAQPINYSTVAKDLQGVIPSVTSETISRYCQLLERIFLLDMQRAWTPALRSRAKVRTSSICHFADVSLAAAALDATPNKLQKDPKTAGHLFESQVFHDLQVFAAPLRGRVFHYRDSSGRELDAVIELPDGRWGAVEVKISGTQVPAAMESIKRTCASIENTEPAFRLVITAMGPTLTATDGTITCPLEALMP